MKKILILGASSFIGSNLIDFLKQDDHQKGYEDDEDEDRDKDKNYIEMKYNFFASYYKNRVTDPEVTSFQLDIFKFNRVEELITSLRPDIIFYCIGMNDLYRCEKEAKLSEDLNLKYLCQVTELSQTIKSKMIFISSQYIYRANSPSIAEKVRGDARVNYGLHISGSEIFIKKNHSNYLIFRPCTLYGRSLSPRSYTIYERVQNAFFRKDPLELDDSLYQGFLDVNYLSMVIKLCLDGDIKNRLFNICSNDLMTEYKFAQLIKKTHYESTYQFPKLSPVQSKYNFLYHPNLLAFNKDQSKEINKDQSEVRPSFALDTKNIENYLKIKFPTIEESLNLTFNRLG